MILHTHVTVRTLAIAALLAVSLGWGQLSAQQSLSFSLFERYLEAFRVEAGIPGMSAAILQDGQIVWERGLGRRDVESGAPATPDTPYLLGDLSQTLGATVLLRKCVDQSYLSVTDRVVRWVPLFPEPQTLVAGLLTHASPQGGFLFAPERFAALTAVVESCAGASYEQLLVDEIVDRLGMTSAVPGSAAALASAGSALPPETRTRYAATLARLATPYRVDRGRAIRTELPLQLADAANGVIASVRDLAQFDAALGSGVLLDPDTLALAWTPAMSAGVPMPTGLGWFVQAHTTRAGAEPLVWHFGVVKDAYSALLLKLPARGLTLVLLANSDGMNAPFALEKGDVTSSLYARLFLRVFAG